MQIQNLHQHWHKQVHFDRYYGHDGTLGPAPLLDMKMHAAVSGSEGDEEDTDSEGKEDGAGVSAASSHHSTATPEESNRILQQNAPILCLHKQLHHCARNCCMDVLVRLCP